MLRLYNVFKRSMEVKNLLTEYGRFVVGVRTLKVQKVWLLFNKLHRENEHLLWILMF